MKVVVTKLKNQVLVGKPSPPFGQMKRRNFGIRKAHTAAKRAAKRRGRPRRGRGRSSYLNGWPQLATQKGGKNNGRAPSYSDRPASR